MKIFKELMNAFIALIALIFLFIFLAPYFYLGILNIGNFAGILICILLLFKFGFKNAYNKLKEKLSNRKITKLLWKIYSICGIIFAVYAVLVSSLMIGFSMDKPENESTVIVLGAKVNAYGPSVALWGRIKGAEAYLESNPNAVAVVTGGQGDDEPFSEAKCMYDTLISSGIDENRIYQEDKATNTYENIKYSYDIIKENDLDDNLAIATDSYHQLRARIIAYKQGVNTEIGAVNAKIDSLIGKAIYPTYFVREWFAIPVEILK